MIYGLLAILVALIFMGIGGCLVGLHYESLLKEIKLSHKVEIVKVALENYVNGRDSMRRKRNPA